MSEADCEAGAGGARVTTPGGVPNLPVGALTLDTLVSRLEDMSPEAMRARAGERWPSIFGYSTGGDIMSDLSLSGIIAKLFSGFNSVVANADPADIDGPEDLPGLLWDFITSLPVVGELVGLLEAIIGEYDGDDEVLLAIQEIFMPLRRLVQLVAGHDVDWPTQEEVAAGWSKLGTAIKNVLSGLIPVGSLTDAPVNVLPAGTFPAGSLPASENWSLGASLSGDGTFSAQVVADGSSHAFRSGKDLHDTFAVTPGQTVAVSFDVGHQSVSWSGPVLVFQMVPYTDGVAGEPVDIVTYTPATATVEKRSLSGSWTVPDGVTGAQTRCLVLPAATAGTIRVDNIFVDRKPAIKQGWVENLPEALQEGIGRWQLMLDILTGGLTGVGLVSQTTLEELAAALLSIPFGNVNGVGGPSNIGNSIMRFLNQLLGGFTGQPDLSTAGISDAYNIATQIGQWATLGAFSWDVLGIRDNRPLFTGFLPSGKSNFNLTDVAFEASAPLIDVTQSASAIAIDRIEESGPIGVVSWIGGNSLTNISAVYINIWKIDSAGGFDLIHHSANIIGDIETSAAANWNFYDLPDVMHTVASDEYAFELVVVGAGTYQVVGKTTWLPNHPRAQVVGFAATRNNTSNPDSPPSHINKGSITRSVHVPWIETALSSDRGTDVHAPVIVYVTKDGTTPIPSWANFIDAIPLGGAGGGGGAGGNPGHWGAVVWRRGTDFDNTVSVVTFARGTGGAGGPVPAAGSDGTASTFSITGHSVSGAGGDGGDALAVLDRTGGSPGQFEFGGQTLKGGGAQAVLGGAGASPGGGGAGRNPVTALLQPGGRGADGAGWLRFRQTPIAGESPLDVTAPLPPTVSVVSVTHSTVTVQVVPASGDSVTVIGYNVYVDGVNKTFTASFDDTITIGGLAAGTTVAITATSVGTYANESAASTPVNATTTAYTPGGEGPLSGPDQALVDSVMGAIVSSGRAWGASIAITGPTGAYRKAYGLAGPAEDTLNPGRALSLDDHFRIGSNTKMFTAWAVLMELDKGHIALTDTVAEHIPPDYFGRRIPNDEAITIEHLLTMRSGLAEYLGNLFLGLKLLLTPSLPYSDTEHLDWIKVYGGNDYGQLPLNGFTYCNSNYILLGEIVKNISGKTIKRYITEEILAPLGMSETSWPDDATLPGPYSRGKWDQSNLYYKEWTVMNPDWGAAAGALVSTVGDLQKWGRELLDGTLLSPEAHDMYMHRVYDIIGTPGLSPTVSGYGFANLSIGSWRGHGGSIPGFDTVSIVNPVTNTVVTAMQNRQDPAAGLLYDDLAVKLLPHLFPGSETLISWPSWVP